MQANATGRRHGSPIVGGLICAVILVMLVLIGHGAFQMMTGGSKSGAARQEEAADTTPAPVEPVPAPAAEEQQPEQTPNNHGLPKSTIII